MNTVDDGNISTTIPYAIPTFCQRHFEAGGNTTPGQAHVPCHDINEESRLSSLPALVKDGTQAKSQWVRYNVHYLVASNLDFDLA